VNAAGWVVLWMAIALVPAFIARRKGLSFWGYYVFGLLLWIVAVPVALLAPSARPRCPDCAEVVQREARRCPHCRSEIQGRILAHRGPRPMWPRRLSAQ